MLDLRVKTGRRHVPLHDLPLRLGRAEAAREIGDTIERLIQFVDELSGDPDLEDNNDREADTSDWEPDDDAKGDPSYAEWHTLPPATRRAGKIEGKPLHPWGAPVAEDAEDDDPDTGCEDGPCGNDGQPGDPEDADDGGDTELNGDEGDHSY